MDMLLQVKLQQKEILKECLHSMMQYDKWVLPVSNTSLAWGVNENFLLPVQVMAIFLTIVNMVCLKIKYSYVNKDI